MTRSILIGGIHPHAFTQSPCFALLTHKTLPIFRSGFKVRPKPKIQELVNPESIAGRDSRCWTRSIFQAIQSIEL
jgi:hypothetical protein